MNYKSAHDTLALHMLKSLSNINEDISLHEDIIKVLEEHEQQFKIREAELTKRLEITSSVISSLIADYSKADKSTILGELRHVKNHIHDTLHPENITLPDKKNALTKLADRKKISENRIQEEYYDRNSPHYRDNSRYADAVKSINEKYQEAVDAIQNLPK